MVSGLLGDIGWAKKRSLIPNGTGVREVSCSIEVIDRIFEIGACLQRVMQTNRVPDWQAVAVS